MSSAPTDFEIGWFAVNEIVEATKTGWDAGSLALSLPELAGGAGQPALAEVTVDIVRPGDPVRVANVLDAVLPTVRADPATTFPGALGRLTNAGRGRTHNLEGVNVLVACDWEGAGYTREDEFPPSFVDMSGPGADRTRYGETLDVVLTCRPVPGERVGEVDRAVRRAALGLARDLAAATVHALPDRIETMRFPRETDRSLPSICAVLQIASEGPLLDTYLYGSTTSGLVPTLIDPLAVLDGAVTNGTYDWPSVRNPTAAYQSSPLIAELLAGDGERFRFAGLILALGYLDTAEDKRRSALQTARLARLIGADAAICTTFSSGNSHTDTMLTVRELEREGIRTCAILAETNGGLTDHVPEADCIVSVGNEDELLEPWTPARVIGGERNAMVGRRVPLWAYLGATGETGELDLTAVAS